MYELSKDLKTYKALITENGQTNVVYISENEAARIKQQKEKRMYHISINGNEYPSRDVVLRKVSDDDYLKDQESTFYYRTESYAMEKDSEFQKVKMHNGKIVRWVEVFKQCKKEITKVAEIEGYYEGELKQGKFIELSRKNLPHN